MKEISSEFDVSREESSGENRETYWKNIFDFKRLNTSKQKLFTGMIETDGVTMYVYYRRLKTDRPVPPSAAPVTNHEDEKEEDPVTQEVEDNGFVVGTGPGNTNHIAIAAPKRAEDGTDGNLPHKDIRLFKLSRARYYRESGIMSARKKIQTWNARVKDHLEATSEMTCRGAGYRAFREFMKVRVAHWEALWREYTKPRWAFQRMNLHCGKQRTFNILFSQLSALKEYKRQRPVVAYGAIRWASKTGAHAEA